MQGLNALHRCDRLIDGKAIKDVLHLGKFGNTRDLIKVVLDFLSLSLLAFLPGIIALAIVIIFVTFHFNVPLFVLIIIFIFVSFFMRSQADVTVFAHVGDALINLGLLLTFSHSDGWILCGKEIAIAHDKLAKVKSSPATLVVLAGTWLRGDESLNFGGIDILFEVLEQLFEFESVYRSILVVIELVECHLQPRDHHHSILVEHAQVVV